MSSQKTETDPLMVLIAQQTAIQVQIDRLLAQRESPFRENEGNTTSTSLHTHLSRANDQPSGSRNTWARNSSEDEESSERDVSVKTPRYPRREEQQVNIQKVERPRVSALKRLSQSSPSKHSSRPLRHPKQGADAEQHRPIFKRISDGGSKAFGTSVEEMERRLKSELKNQMVEMLKAVGHPANSSAAALVKDSESPFAEHIQSSLVPRHFKLPNLESFDGSTDPLDHWQQYNAMMGLQNVPNGIICRTFITTLKGAARLWYNNLPPSSIQDLNELGTKFISHFLGTRKHSKSSSHLFTIKQKASESLKNYTSRFNQESLTINNLNDGVAVRLEGPVILGKWSSCLG